MSAHKVSPEGRADSYILGDDGVTKYWVVHPERHPPSYVQVGPNSSEGWSASFVVLLNLNEVPAGPSVYYPSSTPHPSPFLGRTEDEAVGALKKSIESSGQRVRCKAISSDPSVLLGAPPNLW